MDNEDNQTQGESAASVTHGGLRRRGRLRSIVWEHFEKKKINGIDKAICNYCKNALVARSSDGTKHLHDHLKACQVKKEIEAIEFPPAKKAAGEKGKTLVETHFNPDVTRRKMARAIVMHEYPLSIVEHQGLRDVMSSLNQLWKPIFLEVSGSHTGQVLCDKLMDKNDLILGGQKFHVRCCAHILNLIVNDGLSVIGDLIANIHESVIFWSGSTKRKSTFDENARKLGITSGRKLVQDCPISYPTSNLFLCHMCDIRLCLNECVSTPRDDATSRVQIVYGDCQSIVKEYKARDASAASSPGYSSSSLSTSHSMPSSGSYKGSTEWILRFTSFVNVGNEEVKDELDTYLSEKLVPFNVEEEFDVLAWWKVNGGNYPILSQIARDILAILVTIVASESAFSTGGQFVSPYRNRLHPSTLEALMCSQSWIRALCGVVASTSPAYAKILDEESEIETDVEAIEVYEEF
ncbi:BED-type domain-containing protein [Citrus sinensis]|nr:BED-type domain-containing protein [Citrus sinensis]